MVDQATESWGVKITRVELKDIRPPADIVNAMTRQMKAEREKRAAILESEGMRQSEILRAEGEKQAKILQAEGLKEAAFREAEARERAAQAEANATKSVSDAIEAGSVQAINYFIAQKYVEAIGLFATSPNAKTILFPVEATQLMGTLGGIGELAREALGDKASMVPATTPTVPRVEFAEGRMMDLPAGWFWAIGGLILLIAEIVAPGFFLIFLGVAAIATGLFTLLFDLSLAPQLILFIIYTALAVMIGKRWYAEPANTDQMLRLNNPSERMIGKSVLVVDPVDDHGGRVRVGDGEWSARGGPAPAGARVRVVSVDGNCLLVEGGTLLNETQTKE